MCSDLPPDIHLIDNLWAAIDLGVELHEHGQEWAQEVHSHVEHTLLDFILH